MSRCCSCQEDLHKLIDEADNKRYKIPQGIYDRVFNSVFGPKDSRGLANYLDKVLGWEEARIKHYMTTPNRSLRYLSPHYIEQMGYTYINAIHIAELVNNLDKDISGEYR